MRNIIVSVVGFCVGCAVIVSAQVLTIPAKIAKVAYLTEGAVEVIVVKPTVAPNARVCAEPPEGIVKCRTASEFRAWVAQK